MQLDPADRRSPRFAPVTFPELRVNDPFDLYPQSEITGIIRPESQAYRVCQGGACSVVWNFGHDENIWGIYRDYLRKLYLQGVAR